MPNKIHELFEDYLRKYLKNRIENYYDEVTFELYGNWNHRTRFKRMRFKEHEPDLAILKKPDKQFICIGEAKQIDDYNRGRTDLLPRSRKQLFSYLDWFKENQKSNSQFELIYSVPMQVRATTSNLIRRHLKKRGLQIYFEVIDRWPV